MTERFFIILIFSVVFGAILEGLYRHAPGVAVFVAASLGAQAYLHALTEKKKEIKIKKGDLVFRNR